MGFPGGSTANNLPANARVAGATGSIPEDPLEAGMATHFNILPWRIPRDRRGWRATVHGGHKESDIAERLSTHSRNKVMEAQEEVDLPQAHLHLCGPRPPAGHGLKAAGGRLRKERHMLL